MGVQDERAERRMRALRGHAVQVDPRLGIEPAAAELLEPPAVHVRAGPVERRLRIGGEIDGDARRLAADAPPASEPGGFGGSAAAGTGAGPVRPDRSRRQPC